jgi:hypothetical protein
MTPFLWNESLEEYAFVWVRGAVAHGVPDAELALDDLEERGERSATARAITRCLAERLAEEMRRGRQVRRRARGRLPEMPPALN